MKPHLRFNYAAKAWFFVFYDEDTGEVFKNWLRGNRRLRICEICSGPAYRASWGAVCLDCREAREIEVRESHRIFAGALREGQFQSLPDGKTECVDCDAPAMVWEHRDAREPLSVEPCCRSCNRRRGRAMTAHEASFRQTGAVCAP